MISGERKKNKGSGRMIYGFLKNSWILIFYRFRRNELDYEMRKERKRMGNDKREEEKNKGNRRTINAVKKFLVVYILSLQEQNK